MQSTPQILKYLRNDYNLTQKQLSEKIQIGQSTIVGYEKGEREPTAYALKAYSQFFKVSTDYLLGLESDELQSSIPYVTPTAPALTDKEKKLLDCFRSLVPSMQDYMLANMQMLAAQNG